MENPVAGVDTGESAQHSKKEPLIDRRELLFTAGLVGMAAWAGFSIINAEAEQVGIEQLLADPRRFSGDRIKTECSLEPLGSGSLSYQVARFVTPEFPSLAGMVPIREECQLFRISGGTRGDILVAVKVGDKPPRINEPVQLEGVLYEALLDKRQVFALQLRIP